MQNNYNNKNFILEYSLAIQFVGEFSFIKEEAINVLTDHLFISSNGIFNHKLCFLDLWRKSVLEMKYPSICKTKKSEDE